MPAAFEGTQKCYVGVIGGTGCDAATAQYKLVKFSADNTVVPCSASTDVPCGVLQQQVPAVGDPATVCFEGQTMLQAGASIAAGAPIATNASGQAQTAVATQYVAGQAVNVAGATTAGTLISAVVECGAPSLKA